MNKINKFLKSNLKKKMKITKALMIVFLITGSLNTFSAENVNGLAIGNNSDSRGEGSIATSESGVAHGHNSIVTGNGMSKEEFELKKSELDTFEQKKKELEKEKMNLDNNLDINKDVQNKINTQLDYINAKIQKLNEKMTLLENYKNQINELNTNNSNINTRLSEGSEEYTKLKKYVNFTTILDSLDWNKLNNANGQNELAQDLKTKIDTDFSDFSTKYSIDDYKSIITGYVNSNSGYDGNVRYLENKFDKYADSYNKRYHDIMNLLKYDLNNLNFNKMREYNNIENYRYALISNTRISLRADMDKFISKEDFNTFYMHLKSKEKLENEGKYYLNYLSVGLISSNESSRNKFKNFSVAKDNYILYNLKTKNNKFLPLLNTSNDNMNKLEYISRNNESWDFNLENEYNKEIRNISEMLPSKLTENKMDYNSSNKFLKLYNNYKWWYSEIDWNDSEAAYDLQDYKKFLDNRNTVMDKLKEYYELNIEVIKEKENGVLDSSKENRLVTMRSEINKLLENKDLFIENYELKYTPYADKYEEYAKEEAISDLKELKKLLKYNEEDKIIKEIKSKVGLNTTEYENLQKQKEKNEENIKKLEKEIADLGLSEEDNTLGDKKRKLEEELEKEKQKQQEINDAIAEKEEKIREENEKIKAQNKLINVGEKNVAIGNNNFVSGNYSVAIGKDNTVLGENNFVLGNGVTVDKNITNSIVLGNDSTVNSPILTKNIEIRGTVFTFAGTNPYGTLSIGTEGKERTITNVAAGRISETSTDAINGSQLFAFKKVLDNLKVGGHNTPSEPVNFEIRKIKDDVYALQKDLEQVHKESFGAAASAIAMANAMQNIGNQKHTISAGLGYFGKEYSAALAYSTHQKNIGLKVSGSINSKMQLGIGASISYTFGEDDVKEIRGVDNSKELKDLVNANINLNDNLDKANDRINELEKALKDILANISNKVEVNESIKELRFNVTGYITDKYILTETQREYLDSNIDIMKDKEVEVIGYTDTNGTDKYNLSLGIRRANEVKNYLESKGITNISVKSAGFNITLNQNNSVDSKAENRRVEIIVK